MVASSIVDVVFVHGLFSSGRVWTSFTQLINNDPQLTAFVDTRLFEYRSPMFKIRLDRRIPDFDDIAKRLDTYLTTELPGARPLVLVTHSQGGLIVQRYLTWMLRQRRGRELARIKLVVMFACPNSGAQFLLSVRRSAKWWWNPQERELRPAVEAVLNAQKTVLRSIVKAQGLGDEECRIPIAAYGGLSDDIVPPMGAVWVFPLSGIVDGDHFSIVRPTRPDASSYVALKTQLMTVLRGQQGPSEQLPTVAAGQDQERPAEDRSEQDRAAERVSTPLEAATDSSTDLPWRGSVTAPVSRLGNAPTYGRDRLIALILAPDNPKRVHILAGLGGSGKSRVALEIARRAQQQNRRVWWVNVTRINSSMREVANQAGAPPGQVDRAWSGAASAPDLVWRHLDSIAEPWLLILDNADDPSHLAPADGTLADGTGWLRPPTNANGMVLVTTRDRNETTWGPWCAVHPVPPLDDEDGATLLLNRAGRDAGSYEEAKRLSAQMGGLPLALLAAADYVKLVNSRHVWHGPTKISNFETYRAALRQRFEAPSADGPVLSDLLGEEIVREVCDLALNLLVERGLPQASPLVKLLACLNLTPIPYHALLDVDLLTESALFAGFPAQQRFTVLDALTDLGLVEPHRLPDVTDWRVSSVLSLHPLVQLILRNDEDVKRRSGEYYGLNVRLLLAATQNLDPDHPENWGVWDVLAPHAVEICRTSLASNTPLGDRKAVTAGLQLARFTTRYLIATGLLGPADDLVVPLIEGCRSFGFHQDDEEILALRHEKGRIKLDRGDARAAEEELQVVFDTRKRLFGTKDPGTLASHHKLARAILEQGRWDEAEEHLRSIMEAEIEVHGPEHSDTMVVRHSLARALLAQGEAAETEAMMRAILPVRDRLWSTNTTETLFARRTLARSLMAQGKPDEAESVIRQALSDAQDHPDRLDVLSLRYILAQALLRQERVPELLRDLGQLLDDCQRVLGATHPMTGNVAELLEKTREIPEP